MGTINIDDEYTNGFKLNTNREKELKAFDDTKLGVKGLLDSGVKSLPSIFIRPSNELIKEANNPSIKLQLPVINLEGIDRKDRQEVVQQVLDASQKWGFFQIINHGIPKEMLDNILEGMRMFHEQDVEAKKMFYTRDITKQLVYLSNYDLYTSKAASWRDSFAVNHYISSNQLDPKDLPSVCRDVMMDYINQLQKLGELLLQLLSMALGLEPDYLKELECGKGWNFVNHYYPACPEPALTLGTNKHSDPSFLTILLQNHISGLQVLHENQWVDVQPIPEALIINIGDLLQILSNDKFKSVYHRVVAKQEGPRISVAFFLKGDKSSPKLYGPIKKLLSEDNPALYKEFTLKEFYNQFYSKPLDDAGFEYLRVENHGHGM